MHESTRRTIEIKWFFDDGKIKVDTDLRQEAEPEEIAFAYMSSLVSILRMNEWEDEEIPDVVRETLRAALTGMSEIKET